MEKIQSEKRTKAESVKAGALLSRERSKNERRLVVRLEIAKVLSRSLTPPPLIGTETRQDFAELPKPRPQVLAKPFGEADAWVPDIWAKDEKTGEFKLVKARKPAPVFFRIVSLLQDRFRIVGNRAIRNMWLEMQKPLPPRDPANPRKFLRAEDEEARDPSRLGKIAYQTMACEVTGDLDGTEVDIPYVPGACIAAASRRLSSFYAKHWKNTGGRDQVMGLKSDSPLWLRQDCWRFSRADGLNIAVNFDGTWWDLGLRMPIGKKRGRNPKKGGKGPPDAHIMGVLRRVVAGEKWRTDTKVIARTEVTNDLWMGGTVGIQKHKKKWYVIIQYRLPKAKAAEGDNYMFVHCGLRWFTVALDVVSAKERRQGLWIDGTDLIRNQVRWRARRKDIQRGRRLAQAGRGHHRQVARQNLSFRERQWVNSWLRRIAARVVRDAVFRKCKTIYVMSMKDIRKRVQYSDLPQGVETLVHQAPWYRLAEFITERAADEGISVEKYEPHDNTHRCPKCLTVDDAAPNYRTWNFACVKDGFSANIEAVACMNAMIDHGFLKPINVPHTSKEEEAARERREMAYGGKGAPPPRERRGGSGKRRK